MGVDFAAIRNALRELPRAANHAPGAAVDPDAVVTPWAHRSALDPDRALVVGNRGMGKSLWAHALLQPELRQRLAEEYRYPALRHVDVQVGFNASERHDGIAPSPSTIGQLIALGADPEAIWRAVMARAAASYVSTECPQPFAELVRWVSPGGEPVERLMTEADEHLGQAGKRLLVVFDALDRLGTDWSTTRDLSRALLRRALGARSYRNVRLKIFIRPDQLADPSLFDFPDASKVKNERVNLDWPAEDLYDLLLHHLKRSDISRLAIGDLEQFVVPTQGLLQARPEPARATLIAAIAGEFMGANKKRGRVYSWLPLHLGDAWGQTSPRTFLTAWREAALHGDPPPGRAVDHLGLAEGVRRASEDRLAELAEDYRWIRLVLEPLRHQSVPMERAMLVGLWRTAHTVQRVREDAQSKRWLAPVEPEPPDPEAALIATLEAIGVLEIRRNGKVNVPDIFRVEAGIKRKGGVPPRRPPLDGSGLTRPPRPD